MRYVPVRTENSGDLLFYVNESPFIAIIGILSGIQASVKRDVSLIIHLDLVLLLKAS